MIVRNRNTKNMSEKDLIISLTSNKDTKITGSNLIAKDSIVIKADSIDLLPTAFRMSKWAKLLNQDLLDLKDLLIYTLYQI